MASNSRRWLIFLPVALLALWSTVAKADGLGDWTASQSCATGFVNVVDNSIVLTGPDGGGCGGANWVKIETTIPEGVLSVSFDWSYWTHDGWVYDPPQYGVNNVYTLLTQQNQASGTETVTVTAGDIFTFRQYSIDSCCKAGHLTISNLSLWEFTTTSTTSTTMTTTTIVPETTVLATSTTSTTVPETSTSTTSTTTSTTSILTTTTTSSFLATTTTTLELTPQTSTSISPPQISEPEPVEPSVPVEPEPTETGTTSTSIEEPMPEVTLLPETTTTTEPEITTTEAPEDTTTTLEPDLEPNLEPLAEEEVIALIAEATTVEELQEALEELTPEQVEQVVDEILSQEEPSQEQAVALATSPEVLSVISVDNAEKVFEALQVDELTVEQVSELIEAIQSAPEEIRTQFETSIDIFASDLGDYVPVGSNVPVDTRRTLIAVAAGAAMAAVGSRKFP
jgi:hypothetical protein